MLLLLLLLSLLLLLLLFLVIEAIQVSPSTILVNPFDSIDFILNCTVLSHPLVMINWDGNITIPAPRQLPVGFRGPSVSELMLNSGDLSGGEGFVNCSAEMNQIVLTETIIVNAFSEL